MKINDIYLRIKLLCTILVLLANSVFAEPIIECPEFLLTGVETEIKISNLKQTKAFQYKISDKKTTLIAGISNPTDELKLKISLINSGVNNLIFTAGNQEAVFSVRSIPGWLSVIPVVAFIFLFFTTKQLLLSLIVGVFIGSMIFNNYNPLVSFIQVANKYLLCNFLNENSLILMLILLFVNGIFGIIIACGSIKAFTDKFSFFGPKTAQLTVWFSGIFAIFGDALGAQFISNMLNKLCQNSKISKEKFSFIVNSISISVASLSVISIWFAVEIAMIKLVNASFSIGNISCYELFVKTLPYRFYSLLTIFFAFFIINSRKDFGPILAAEIEASSIKQKSTESDCKNEKTANKSMLMFFVPILLFILSSLVFIPISGNIFSQHFYLRSVSTVPTESNVEYKLKNIDKDFNAIIASTKGLSTVKLVYDNKTANYNMLSGLVPEDSFYCETDVYDFSFADKFKIAFAQGNIMHAMLWGAIFVSLITLPLAKISSAITIKNATDSFINGMKSIATPMCAFVLILSLFMVCTDLGTLKYLASYISSIVPYWLLPTVVFIIAMVASLLTGSSFGTMATFIPIAAAVAFSLNQDKYNADIAPLQNATDICSYLANALAVNISAVIEGTVFGTHCSPLSITSIVTSNACEIDHKKHIKSQAPYAALVGLVSIIFCFIPAGLGFSPYLLIVIGGMILASFVMAFGRFKINTDKE